MNLSRDLIADYFAKLAVDTEHKAKARINSARALQGRYAKLKQSSQAINLDHDQRLIYGPLRLLGTLASLTYVLDIFDQYNIKKPESIIDAGSGPGTALLASIMKFGSMPMVAVEKDQAFIAIARAALSTLCPEANEVEWHHAALPGAANITPADLVIFSYLLSENPEQNIDALIDWAVAHSRAYLLLVDAGTPRVHTQMMRARERLLQQGLQIVAPCPHAFVCPMLKVDDFCHFKTRFNRHHELKRLKNAKLGYEDEKFSYLLMARADHMNSASATSRIIKNVNIRGGHRIFDTCHESGELRRTIISKKSAEYSECKKLVWGDRILQRV